MSKRQRFSPVLASQFSQLRYRSVLIASLLMGGNLIAANIVFAASPIPGTVIENQATGSYLDTADNTTKNVASDIVKATVAEVAGITINPANTPTATTGSVANFDFTIANVGNDPTKFFLPTAPSSVTGGTAGTLQVVGYIPAGGSQVTLATPINITTAGNTGALSDPTLGGNTMLGSIPAGAAIVVRVPVTITAAGGSPVNVTLGNTTGQPATNNTPYIAQTNDLYTFDNPNTPTITGEATGVPINGDTTLHQQEASATRSVTAIAVDYGDAPDTGTGIGTGNYRTIASDNGPSHIIVSGLKLGTNLDGDSGALQDGTATADNTNGIPDDEDAFTTLPNISTSGTYILSNIPVTNTVGNATLHAWVDFNKNGSFEASEYTSTTVANGATSANLSWTVPTGTTAASTYARLRLTTQTLTDNAGTAIEDERSLGLVSDGEVEDYAVTITGHANVLLVKRITAINGDRTKNPNDNTPLNVFVDDALTNDNNANWPNPKSGAPPISNFLQGVIDAGKIIPGDKIEYTIYFLNADTGGANGVKICDRIAGSQSLLTGAYGTGKDIQLHKGDGNFTTWLSAATSDLTSVNDTGDRAQLMVTSSVPSICHLDMVTGGATDTGTLVIDITGTGNINQPDWSPLSGSTGAGMVNSYGFIRFTTKVNP